ncbi:hypothetical protein HNV12_24540 [Methanococcoides sp. SA1]|nr:hypothetical protein [Methanococcoides sp. SA1]
MSLLQSSTDIDEIDQKIYLLVNKINLEQAEALSLRLAAAFVAGSNSITSTIYSKDKKKLSEQQERAIKQLSAAHFGYISEFNRQMGEQLKDHAREILRQEGGYKEIASYTKDVLSGSEKVVINNVGKTRTIIQVGKDGTLSEVEKVITRPYVTSVDNYADMLGRTATHSAWAEGRAVGHQKLGFKKWRFVGPTDERSRPDHCAVIGNVYEYGTSESGMALKLLHEPLCRHRSVVFFDDPELDTPAKFFEEQKRKAGLRYDDKKEKWVFEI